MIDQLHQRRRAYASSRRMTPVGPCGCIRHPEVDKHRCGGEITDVLAEAAVAAAVHLRRLGVPGLFDTDTCRAMWPLDPQLAAESFRYSHGEAA